jgi:predicted HAD superfamily Cof-like phosphohydrolase
MSVSRYIDIVFDGPPDHKAPAFVEVETDTGKSVKIGEWVARPDGYWVLRLRLTSDNADVMAFQRKFDIPMAPHPAFLDQEAEEFRIKFMQEELDEYNEACEKLDIRGAADALVDLVYVAHGTALMMGLPWDKLWNEVQRANMTKERATSSDQSKRKNSLDVIKPAGWTPPDHGPALGHSDPYAIFDTKTRNIR